MRGAAGLSGAEWVFVLVILACLMVITYVPQLSLGLRDAVYPESAKAAAIMR